MESRCHPIGDRLGVAAEDRETLLVGDGAVVGDVEQLVRVADRVELRDEDLDFEGLHLVGEDLAEVLGIHVRERAGVDVLARVRVALGVGVAHAGDPKLVELVVAPDTGEGDAVIDLADLVQRARRVLGDDQHAAVVGRADERATSARSPSGRTRRGPS